MLARKSSDFNTSYSDSLVSLAFDSQAVGAKGGGGGNGRLRLISFTFPSAKFRVHLGKTPCSHNACLHPGV